MVKRLIVRGASKREAHEAPTPKQRPIALIELITTAALALSTAVAATAVSIGIARADVLGAVTHGDTTPLAIALCFGLLLCAMGGLTAVVALAHVPAKWVPVRRKEHAPLKTLEHVPFHGNGTCSRDARQ